MLYLLGLYFYMKIDKFIKYFCLYFLLFFENKKLLQNM
jgi:hypothetical protein